MRPFESILLLSLVALIYQLVFAKRTYNQPMRLFYFALIIAVVHLMFENYRWQMVPVYLSFGILYLRLKIGELKFTQRYNKITWALWISVTTALPIVVPIIDLPVPSGPYSIGTQVFHWVDSSRTEWFTPEVPDDLRELMVQVWYPASATTGQLVPYINNLEIRKEAIGKAGGLPGFLVGHIDLTITHAYENAPIMKGAHPMLILSHGITSYRQMHTSLVENLASHGYIVVAPDHTYDCNLTVFPDGRLANYRSDITGHPDSIRIRRQQLNTRVADIRFLIDKMLSFKELKPSIDPDKIGVLGHSYGGATSIQAAFEDVRVKAVLVLDSWMNPVPSYIIETGISQPFLYIGRPHWNESEYPNSPGRLIKFNKNLTDDYFHYILSGSMHLDFCDAPLFSPLSDLFLETGTIPAKKAVFLTNTTVEVFFDKYLKNKPNDLSDVLNVYSELLEK